jgi:hypothetical protein
MGSFQAKEGEMTMKPATAWFVGLMVLMVSLSTPTVRAATVCGTWSPSPTPNPSSETNRFTGAAAISATDVWAVGFYDANPDPVVELDQSLIAHWNGTTWSVVSSPNVGPSGTVLTGVAAVASNDVWAVGYSSTYGTPQTLALHWNGSSWSVVPSPAVQGGSGFLAIAATSTSDIWAVGYRAGGLPDFTTTTGTMIAHWNGSTWTEVPSPNVGNRHNELDAVAAISTNDVWAVGTWRHMAGNFQTLTEHWDGSSWTIVSSPNPSIENQLSAVAGVAGSDVWATGGGWDGVTSTPLFFHWTGSNWNQVSSPGGAGGGLITLASNDAWAVAGNITHWDGASWSLVPNPVVSGATWLSLNAVTAVSGCEAWAVGSHGSDISSRAQTLAVRLTAGDGPVNQPPFAEVSASPSSGPAPLTVSFSSAGSFDPDGSIVSYRWNFGDSTDPPNQTSANPVHTYTQSGPLTYHATLAVVDDQGGTASASVQINITTATPVVHVGSQSVSRVQLSNRRWQARDVVQVVDGTGAPIPEATVSAQFSGPTSGMANGTTDGLGLVTLKSTAAKQATKPWCFTVVSISASGHTYLPSANVVTTQCEGSPGVTTGVEASLLRLEATPSGARIHVSLARSTVVDVRIFDVAGRHVRTLVREQRLPSGAHVIDWDGRADDGRALPSGIYFTRADAGGARSLGRICIVR